MSLKQRMKKNLTGKLKDARAMGTTLLMSGLIIGFGMPMLAAGWDINTMRIYKVDVQNVADMGLLSILAHTENTFNPETAHDNATQVMACNFDPANLAEGVGNSSKTVCATYHLDKSNKPDQQITREGNRRRATASHKDLGEPPYRPGLTVTSLHAEIRPGDPGKFDGWISAKYKPIFLGRLVKTVKGDEYVNVGMTDDMDGGKGRSSAHFHTVQAKFLDSEH